MIEFCDLILEQVQLLVSDSDVESYKQIKTDLDGLRLLVEKSELWVYKAKIATTEADENDNRPIVAGDIVKPNATDEEIDEEGHLIATSLFLLRFLE